MSLPDLRVGRWSLHLRTEDASLAEACGASTRDLASATLAPILAALAPADDEILVLDRLALPPLTLGPQDNGGALRTYIAQAARGALPPAHRRFANRQAALVAFVTAAAQVVADDIWLWTALDFLAPAQGPAEMPDQAARLIAEAGAEALPLLMRLAVTGPSPHSVAALWPRLSTASVVALADTVAPHVQTGSLDVQVRAAGRVARALLQAAAPAFLTLPTTAESERATATARVALAAAGAAALPAVRFASLVAGAVRLYAAPPALQSANAATSNERFSPHAHDVVRSTAVPPIQQATDTSRPRYAPSDYLAAPQATGAQRPHRPRPDRSRLVRVPEASPVRLPTMNGGLLFLLNLIPETSLLSSRGARHGVAQPLVRLALAVGVQLDDPATRAIAGLWPSRIPFDDDPHRPLPEPSPAPLSTGRLIEDLQAALARRPSTGLTLAQIVRRPAHLTFAAAEIDMHLPLVGIDICIRRAALDTSPGFLPWLGAIVRFHYEER